MSIRLTVFTDQRTDNFVFDQFINSVTRQPHTNPRKRTMTGIEAVELALDIIAEDNCMRRTETVPEVDDLIQEQALRCLPFMETFCNGQYHEVKALAERNDVQEFNDWLNRAFDGDLTNTFFEEYEDAE